MIGPESTGKSTLSEALAKELNTVWVKEYAREYLEERNGVYQESDLLNIAGGQIAAEDREMLKANKYLICDTDLNVIKIWSEHAYNGCQWRILQSIAERGYDFYLLTSIDMPWQEDPLREHGNEKMRLYFYKQYHDLVINSGIPFALIKGSETERLAQAINVLAQYFNQ